VRSSPPPHQVTTSHVVRSTPHPSPPPSTTKEKEPVPAVSTSTAGSAAPANDCNPPYYFEGRKKIFKPACI